jgi:hypothetical protein
LGQLVLVHPGRGRAHAAVTSGARPGLARHRVSGSAGRAERGIPRAAQRYRACCRRGPARHGLATFLTAWDEQRVSSSVAGILTATDPLFTAVLALWLIRSEAVDRKRFTGLIVGFAGVAALLGIDVHGHAGELLGGGAVLLSALGYAAAALVYRRWLADAPALGGPR